MSVSLPEETGAPGRNQGPKTSNWHTFTLCPIPVPNPGPSSVKPCNPRRHESNALAHWATSAPSLSMKMLMYMPLNMLYPLLSHTERDSKFLRRFVAGWLKLKTYEITLQLRAATIGNNWYKCNLSVLSLCYICHNVPIHLISVRHCGPYNDIQMFKSLLELRCMTNGRLIVLFPARCIGLGPEGHSSSIGTEYV